MKPKYDSEVDDILQSFYTPALKVAENYDRSVGYFSSEVLASAAEGLEVFVETGGTIRLVIGDPLDDSEYEAVMRGLQNPVESRIAKLSDILFNSKNYHLDLLTYLIAKGQLKIKFAFTHKGMFHKKIGIFYKGSEKIVFSGSANETLAGLTKYNSEEISVYFSWRDSFCDYGQDEINKFELLWQDQNPRTKVIALTSDFYKSIQNGADLYELKKQFFPLDSNQVEERRPFFSYSFKKSKTTVKKALITERLPALPLMLKGRVFELFEHQKLAIKSWKNADYKGLFKLATGAGKTITSITCIVDLYKERSKAKLNTFVIISVPYIELANQWVDELTQFNISAIRCYENSKNWTNSLKKKLLLYLNGKTNFACLVVVNRTLVTDTFQAEIEKLPNDEILFIGDECHHLGSNGLFDHLPNSKHRIGLSATPFRSDEDEVDTSPFTNTNKENLINYFQGIVSEYSLSDAIKDNILSPYYYEIVGVELEEEEYEFYEEITQKISRLINQSKNQKLSPESKLALSSLCGERSRLLATCNGKLPALINYIEQNPTMDLTHSLIYVGEGKAQGQEQPYIEDVTKSLFTSGVKVAKFTSYETGSERKSIMENFKNQFIDALVAMKVLDEGIDVPVCKTAFILASSRNPRQYVQRRGRVLRKSHSKNEAKIIDFLVLPPKRAKSSAAESLRKAELERVTDFKMTSINPSDVEIAIKKLGLC
ncbi:DEAD/DEAH box helicase family protein [Pseudoalteromonas sp. G4]|uniref:DEAD/DEAH box helicase family protein n=1 Tax=Pseudoalteromonas sp. G4 TaxID=2992761 RepID=UPI00237D9BD6|nr:DEAD/DEAH box helicase family protein [Pseudoalteromonas sp. G4]MDE3271794.1 DEAD/DEAH box helicase family protein [Pseudoalteromonas sp. G4]